MECLQAITVAGAAAQHQLPVERQVNTPLTAWLSQQPRRLRRIHCGKAVPVRQYSISTASAASPRAGALWESDEGQGE